MQCVHCDAEIEPGNDSNHRIKEDEVPVDKLAEWKDRLDLDNFDDPGWYLCEECSTQWMIDIPLELPPRLEEMRSEMFDEGSDND